MTELVLAVTGHRPDKLGGWNEENPLAKWVQQEARIRLERMRPAKLICGMALGFDTWCALLALELSIPLIAAIPCEGQELVWPHRQQRERYHSILKLAADVHVVSPGKFTKRKMQNRNEWMVDRCHVLMAAWDGSAGGTANCCNYAVKRGVPITRIDPLRFAA